MQLVPFRVIRVDGSVGKVVGAVSVFAVVSVADEDGAVN